MLHCKHSPVFYLTLPVGPQSLLDSTKLLDYIAVRNKKYR